MTTKRPLSIMASYTSQNKDLQCRQKLYEQILRTVIENDYKENAFVIKKAFELQQQQSLRILKPNVNG